MNKVKTVYIHIRNLIISGIIFMIPVFVVYKSTYGIYEKLKKTASFGAEFLNLYYFFGPYAVVVANLFLFGLILYLLGWLVKLGFMQSFKNFLEENVLQFIPGYLAIKSQVLYKVAPEQDPRKPVMVKTAIGYRFGLLIEEKGSMATIFFPNTPDTYNGQILLEKIEDCTYLDLKPKDMLEKLQGFGEGLCPEGIA